jgi:anti-sigma factor RsiW
MTQDLHTLQPYIDGELTDAERAEVEAQLAADPGLRALAEEQLQIRQVLRDLPRQTAPQALRARVLLALDEVDREDPRPAPAPTPRFGRLRAFFRGAAVMLPAGAAALALFVVARSVDPPAAAPPPSAAPRDLAVTIVDVPEDSSSPIRPVSLNTASAADEVVYQVGRQQIVDRRARAGATELPGREQVYRGASYHLAADADGRPLVIFEVDGVRHTLRAAAAADRNLQTLLELGHHVRTGAAR